MKHLRRILSICLAVVMMCSSVLVVRGEGVVFRYRDPMYNNIDWKTMCEKLKDWLINTPYWAIDIFWPGFSTQCLMNSPDSDTIDFDIIPNEGPIDTVIVEDIPEEYRNLYNDLISKEIKNEGKIEISNVVLNKGSLIFDCNAYIDLHVGYDPLNPGIFGYMYDDDIILYAVMIDKESQEIIRYDFIDRTNHLGHYVDVPTGETNDPSMYVIGQRMIYDFPENYDPEKHEYGFCFLVYSKFEVGNYIWSDYIYEGDISLYTLTKVNVPGELPFGDVNEDGKLNLYDASMILKYIAGWKDVDLNKNLSDVNADLKTDLGDVSKLLKIIAGWSNCN